MESIHQQIFEHLTQIIETHLENASSATMLASEDVLRRDWEADEENEAWGHL